jgi:hypothetical protein
MDSSGSHDFSMRLKSHEYAMTAVVIEFVYAPLVTDEKLFRTEASLPCLPWPLETQIDSVR